MWWPLGRELAPGEAAVFYGYFQNPSAPAPPDDPAAVLSPTRGWARTATDELLFSRNPRPSVVSTLPRTTVHVRQVDPDSYEALVTDESDNGTATATITVADTTGAVIFDSGVVGDLQGTVGAPMTQLFTFDSTATSFVIQVGINDSNDTRFIFGDDATLRGAGEFVETRTYTRETPVGPDPTVAQICGLQTMP